MKYTIGMGYYCRPGSGLDWFYNLWWKNTVKYSNPDNVVVIATGGCRLSNPPGEWICLGGDIGNVGDILHGKSKLPFPSSAMVITTLALIAYINNTDFIYKEQDVLAFGKWVEKIYDESGDMGMMIGRQKHQPCANSLFMVKHWYILDFVRWYLSTPPETEISMLSEHKYFRLQAERPDKVGYFSFGYDRDRPFNISDEVWYAQKFTPQDLQSLAESGLIEKNDIPPVELFSNNK